MLPGSGAARPSVIAPPACLPLGHWGGTVSSREKQSPSNGRRRLLYALICDRLQPPLFELTSKVAGVSDASHDIPQSPPASRSGGFGLRGPRTSGSRRLAKRFLPAPSRTGQSRLLQTGSATSGRRARPSRRPSRLQDSRPRIRTSIAGTKTRCLAVRRAGSIKASVWRTRGEGQPDGPCG